MDRSDEELFAKQMREGVNDCWESSDFLYRLHQAIDLYDMVYGQYEDSFLKNRYGNQKELAQKEARIRELEDILKSVQGVIINNDNVRVEANQIGSDLAVQLLFERVEKALSEKSD